ncbi:hypothetical protein Sps_01473 [Shewanella psychrophila]|uniref:Uncharacterized protein n=1 Tax=Shewanella psychrophila TaxID=225848 RepID=A0A1S6HMA9_9GAMM|nr:hypothetical protein [Shewanella psychrophila]AQS36639.1 hypothetical protein Sps_01473 [Shewanella psychrophila]
MSGNVIVSGDDVVYNKASFSGITLIGETNISISGKGHASINNKQVCVLGDEASAILDVGYNRGLFLAGQGTLSIKKLKDDQQASEDMPDVDSAGILILAGQEFEAEFTITTPGTYIDSTGKHEDEGAEKISGSGTFTPTETWVTVAVS